MNGTGAAVGYGDLLVTSLVVLGGVCVAAFVVVRLLGRALATGRARGAHLLEVVARVPLEPRRALYVVEVAGKTLLVGTSEMGMSLLTELDPAEVRARAVGPATFGELVRQAWTRRRGLRDATAAGGAPDERNDHAADVVAASAAARAREAPGVEGAESAGPSAGRRGREVS